MKILLSTLVLSLAPLAALADTTLIIPVNQVDEKGVGANVGQVVVSESSHGLVFTPKLTGLPAGTHGFHVHENGNCAAAEKEGKSVAALGAGAHYDPNKTGHHGAPWGDGHLGDLPALYVDSKGEATQPVLAPRLKLADIKGRAIIIHAGGDNHSDTPAPLGGGGARLFCGVIPK